MVTKREQGVVILKTKSVKRDTEVHFIMIKGPIDLEDKISISIIFQNICILKIQCIK